MSGDQYHRSIGDYFPSADDLSTIFPHGSSGHGDDIDDFYCIDDDVEDPLSSLPFTSFSDYFRSSVVDYGQLDVDAPSTHSALFGGASGGGGGKLGGSGGTGGTGTSTTQVTPNSSVSWSSTEAAAGEEDSLRFKKEVAEDKQLAKDQEQEAADKSKKANNKPRKKGEKRQREHRFAFVTKSEVDNLEDGYRWRKYGQKAVKNSPYPRSYYRCTTQTCVVKKRVERSFKEPSIVITTYEGQHTHESPATVRGSSHMILPPPPLQAMPPSLGFHQDLVMHQYVLNNNSQMQARALMNPNMYMPSPLHQQQQQLKFPDHGLLQDIVLSSSNPMTNHDN